MVHAISPPDRSLPPEPLPGAARALLHPRMAAHAQDMAQLMSAIMVLRYPEIEERANHMANQAHFPRPDSQDGTASDPPLPEKFFAYERSQRLLARTLASAAKERQPFLVAHAYGQLSETCVECHAVYRAGR
jgi:cytochrome c556